VHEKVLLILSAAMRGNSPVQMGASKAARKL
jgi:hypothetical protein